MKNNKSVSLIKKILITSLIINLSGFAFSDGYRNPPATAKGIAKGGNHIVFVDDASAISFNPANLAFRTNTSFVSSVTFAHTDASYTDSGTGLQAVGDDPWQPLPNTYISLPAGEGVVLGLGITTPYGQGTKFERNALPDMVNSINPLYEARMALINFNPTIAVQVNDNLAIGAGLNLIYSQLEFTQYTPAIVIPPVVFPPFPGDTIPDGKAEVESDGFAIGGNFGVTWKAADRQRVALTYRSPFRVEYKGDFALSSFNGIATGIPLSAIVPGTTPKSDFATEIIFPTIIGFGYGIELTETVQLEVNVEWLEWSLNKSQQIDLSNNQPILMGQDEILNNWNDTFTYGAGGNWQVTDTLNVSAGYTFIETPIPGSTLSPLLSDADRHAMSLGLGYSAGAHTVDVSYTFSIYDDRSTSPDINPVFPGTYDVDSDLLGLTYSLMF